MGDATVASVSNPLGSEVTIRPEEAAHFAALARDWWDPRGRSAMLHRLNPVRLAYIRDAIDLHWGCDIEDLRPLAGKRALDVGCGAGLVTEPLARMGAEVTGIDAAAENLVVATRHAEGQGLLAPEPTLALGAAPAADAGTPLPEPSPGGEGLSGGSVRYLHGELSALEAAPFDLVTCLEVIEHVADKPALVAQLARHLAPGGLLVLSTPNRTQRSRLLLVGAAEAVGMIPRGTHRWSDFITPDELRVLLATEGLAMGGPRGIAYSPGKGMHLSGDLSLDYIVTIRRS